MTTICDQQLSAQLTQPANQGIRCDTVVQIVGAEHDNDDVLMPPGQAATPQNSTVAPPR